MAEKKKRIKYVDYLKCFAIFLVILGHTLSNMVESSMLSRITEDVIYSFHMPLFAMLSGLFFSASSKWNVFISKKSIQLLIPYFFEVLVVFLLIRPVLTWYNGGGIESSVLMYVFYSLAYWGAWFLRALFLCFLIAFVSVKVTRSYVSGALISILIIHGIFWFGIIPNKQQALQGFLFLYPFFWVGWAVKYYEKIINYYLKSLLIFVFIVYILSLVFWDSKVDTFYYMNTCILATEGDVGFPLMWKTTYRFIIGVCGSLTFYLIFKVWSSKFGISDGLGGGCHCLQKFKLDKLFIGIGKCTLGIYILQSIIFDNWDLIGYRPFSFVDGLFFSVMLLVIFYIVVILLSRWRLGELVLRGKYIKNCK